MNAYAYIRVSGLGQADKDGPVRQLAEIKSFASANGVNVVGDFSDVITGESDSSFRPGWCAMIASMQHLNAQASLLPESLGKNIRVDYIIAENMTRLGRSMWTTENLLRDCQSKGIKVLIPSFGLKDVVTMEFSPEQVFCRQMLTSASQLEKSYIVGRLKAARDRTKARTGRCEGNKPYGYRKGESEMIFLAFQLFNEQKQSYAQVARLLNISGYRTRTGNKWKRSSVQYMLDKGSKT